MFDDPCKANYYRALGVGGEVMGERARQLFVEGYAPERDDSYTRNELALAAAAYLVNGTAANVVKTIVTGDEYRNIPSCWPRDWNPEHFKPTNRRRDLVKAGALILAEIERIDRAAGRSETDPGVRIGARGEIVFIDDEGSGQ